MNHEKVALIFGGARGIGRPLRRDWRTRGYRVAITWVSRPDRAQALVPTIEQRGGQAIAIEADKAQTPGLSRLRWIRHYGTTAGWMSRW